MIPDSYTPTSRPLFFRIPFHILLPSSA
ncbi:hypothetical protein IEO21_08478 [Rhodonia placenta]|uniref:Uncharacterized protein n=1 Tax=Rhodonia placenta TaxID=104341 RepID=A0A8H7NW53_9APHY|nr:hypothetical protein IEO21_08478 [Postia placenta]